MMLKSNIINLFFCFFLGHFCIAKSINGLNLNKMLKPIDSTNICVQHNQYVWCNNANKGEDAAHPLVSLWELTFKNRKKLEMSHLELPFVVTDRKGSPLALFAAAAEKSPYNVFEVKEG